MHYRLLIVAAVASMAQLAATLSSAQAPHATVAEDHYAFGSVAQGTHLNHAFVVKNSGDDTLRFSAADLSMPGMQVRMAPGAVPPGGEGTVTVDWSTDHVAGAIEGVARVRSNDPARAEIALTLSGSITPLVSIEPLPAVFLSAYADEPVERVLTIRNNGGHPLALTGVEPGPHVAAKLATVEPGKVFTVTVRAAAHTSAGKYEESLTLKTDAAGAGQLTIPVHIWIKTDMYANPDAVDFGTVSRAALLQPDAAAALTQTAMLKRRTGAFEIKSIASDSRMVAATQEPSGPSDSFAIQVRLRLEALTPGAKIDGKIRVATTDPDFPEIVIPVTGAVAASTSVANRTD